MIGCLRFMRRRGGFEAREITGLIRKLPKARSVVDF